MALRIPRSVQDSLTAGRPFRLLLRAYSRGLSLTHKAFTFIMLRISSSSSASSPTAPTAPTRGRGGFGIGTDVGADVGEVVTSSLTSVGADVGEVVGEDVGPFVGEAEGSSVAGSGASVGEVVGDFVDGPDEGTWLGTSLDWLDESGGGPQNDGSRTPPVQTTDLIHSCWLPTVV